jgi:hypothetical protein
MDRRLPADQAVSADGTASPVLVAAMARLKRLAMLELARRSGGIHLQDPDAVRLDPRFGA